MSQGMQRSVHMLNTGTPDSACSCRNIGQNLTIHHNTCLLEGTHLLLSEHNQSSKKFDKQSSIQMDRQAVKHGIQICTLLHCFLTILPNLRRIRQAVSEEKNI